ncbi:molecular chaperone DnaJ [Marivirga sp.]|uniref:molecular chaperone DnaJ n=1 Tax=Marivirga sp. TaxID=2018662 RepID=UPI002D80DE4D|nr:molecular chaperone DnaJ [Marivirga sp.]HET8859064.1 molecular chaperone DnaJ [Marivirga sp.]
MKYYFLGLISLFLFTSEFSFAQGQKETLNFHYESAQKAMNNGNYEEANIQFREILKLGVKLPSEMPYLFAKTLFEVGQYQNSQSFLEKYFEIMGKAGIYYKNAEELKKLIDLQLNKSLSCDFCDFSGYRLDSCVTCNGEKQLLKKCDYCEGKGKVSCTACSGDGVLIQLGTMGNRSYKTCHQCKGMGFNICPVCEGEKELYTYCPNCLGSGLTSTEAICNHTENN